MPSNYESYAKKLAKRLLDNPTDKGTQQILEGLISKSGVSSKGLLGSSTSLESMERKIRAAKDAADKLSATVGTYQRLNASQMSQLKASVRQAEQSAKVYRKFIGPIPKVLSDTLKEASFGSRESRRELAKTGWGGQLSLFGRATPTVKIEKREIESISKPLEEMVKHIKAGGRQLPLDFGGGGGPSGEEGRPSSRWRGHWSHQYLLSRLRHHYPMTSRFVRGAYWGARGADYLAGGAGEEAAAGALGGAGLTALGIAAGAGAPLLALGGAYETQHLMLKGIGKYFGAITPLQKYQEHLALLSRFGGASPNQFAGFGGGAAFKRFSHTVYAAGNKQLNAAIAASMGLPYGSRGAAGSDVRAIELAQASKYMGGLGYGTYASAAVQGRSLGLYQGGHLQTFFQRYYLPTIAKGVKEGVQSAQTFKSIQAGIQSIASKGLSVNPQFVAGIIAQMQGSGIAGLRTMGAQQQTIGSIAQAAMNPAQNAFRFLAVTQRLRSLGVRVGMKPSAYQRLLGASPAVANQLSKATNMWALGQIAGGYGNLNNQVLPAVAALAHHISGGDQALAAKIIERQFPQMPKSEALQWALPQKQRLTNQVQNTLAMMGHPAAKSLTATYAAKQKHIETKYADYQNKLLTQSQIVYETMDGFTGHLEKAATAVQNFTAALGQGGLMGAYEKISNMTGLKAGLNVAKAEWHWLSSL